MKKRFIFLLIVAITVSLLGLVGIQIYWIRNAVSVKEANFDRGVSEAVIKAINKFNKIEMARKILLQQERSAQMSQYYQMLDSLNREYYDAIIGSGNNSEESPDSGNIYSQESFHFSITEHENGRKIRTFDTSYVRESILEQGIAGYAPSPARIIPEDPVRMFFDRSKFINDLFEDLFSTQYPFQISGEESVKTLDSLLNAELKTQGIKTEFDFAVFNPFYNSVVAQKTGKNIPELLQSPYYFNLYPNDIFINPEYLHIYFPKQQSYILAQTNAMLITSSVFIMLIISSFAFTMFTIIRQKKLSVMKNDFINNMTHELKTPISTISLACQALKDQDIGKSEDLYQSYIKMIDEENQRLGLMTEKVLQTALIEKGKLRLNRTGLDVHDLINEAIRKISLQVEAKHGNISSNLNAQYNFIEADKVHLTNVFVNLLDNANKYSPTSPNINVSTENTSRGILVHVQDKGIGISKANQKKIFENLYRVSTGNIHDVKGFGLGLSYVKAIVEKHGGYISLESELKKGSRFSVFIPFGFDDHQKNDKKTT
jgi:two-component system phosphate regulon sensor histidine kinase PhoR